MTNVDLTTKPFEPSFILPLRKASQRVDNLLAERCLRAGNIFLSFYALFPSFDNLELVNELLV